MNGYRLARQIPIFNQTYAATQDAKPSKVESVLDGQDINQGGINDYSGNLLKEERANFDSTGNLEVVRVCTSHIGGMLDNPGLVTKACGNVLDKFEKIWRTKKGELLARWETEFPDSSVQGAYRQLHPCQKYIPFTAPEPEVMGIFKGFLNLPKDTGDLGELEDQSFYDTIEETCEKLNDHLMDLGPKVIAKCESKYMMAVLGSIAFTRNFLWIFNEHIHLSNRPKPFGGSYSKFVEFTDAFAQQVSDYHSTLVATVVLQDPVSQDWSSDRIYLEGDTPSKCIKFWWLFMQGLRSDLYNNLPAKIGFKIFGSVLNQSLSILAVRYSQAKPSMKRASLFRNDITAILLIIADLLYSVCENADQVFYPIIEYALSRSIHAKAQILLWNLVLIGCPLKTLNRVSNLVLGKPGSLAPIIKPREETLIHWLHIIQPGVYRNCPSKLDPAVSVYLSAKMAGNLPGPSWGHVVRACLSQDFILPMAVMNNIGAFIPDRVAGESTNTKMTDGCGNLMCSRTCYSSADVHWPQKVGSGLLYLVMHGCQDKECLKKVMDPILRKLDETSFEVLDKNMAWNCRKPVWFQSVADLLEMYFIPILEEVLEDVEIGVTNVNEAIRKISSMFMDVSSVIPPSFFQVCEVIEGIIPDDISPICDSVVVHVMISKMYQLITILVEQLVEGGCKREIQDFFVALGEGLINMTSNTDIQRLEGLTDASANAKSVSPHLLDTENEENNFNIAEMIAFDILSTTQGGVALKAVHRFLAYNTNWIGQVLGIQTEPEVDDVMPSKPFNIEPWGYLTYSIRPSPDAVKTIGGVRFEQTIGYPIDWEAALRHTMATAPHPVIAQLSNRRGEMTNFSEAEASEIKMANDIFNILNKKE